MEQIKFSRVQKKHEIDGFYGELSEVGSRARSREREGQDISKALSDIKYLKEEQERQD